MSLLPQLFFASILLFRTTSVLCSNLTDFKGAQLVTVVLVFRHGDRVIVQPYPNDPYKNASYWPVGWGQLTNEGKLEQLELGEWLRNRYQDFLPEEYSEKDIFIRSTDVDRTLMSAEVNLAGLYPPRGPQVWDRDIPWQPIPIHTSPELQDAILAMKRPCLKYDMLLNELMQSPEIIEINKENQGLYDYVSENTGVVISNFDSLEYIYDNLAIEARFNFSLPNWTKEVFPDKMKPLAEFSFAIPTYTSQMARLKTGPFIHELLGNLFNVTDSLESKKGYHKLWMYSGHDTTIANILQSLGLFEYHCPPYTSTILFELRQLPNGSDYFVNVFYKNTSQPQAMTLKGCDFNCPLRTFRVLLESLNLNLKQWEMECRPSLVDFITNSNEEIAIAIGVLLLGLILILVIAKVIYNRWRKSDMIYLRLPDDDDHV